MPINFLGFNLYNQTLRDLLRDVESIIAFKEKAKIMYLNIHVVNQAFKNKKLKKILQTANILYCDGEGVRLGARIFGKYIPHRMTGADWIYDLCGLCEKKGLSLYIVGARPGVNEKSVHALEKRYPELKIAGYHHGYFDKKGVENDTVIDNINKSGAEILLVGFGTPIQETWIDKNLERLNVPVIWAMGAVMDYVSGEVKRAPAWMHQYGMEWVFRLAIEPKRMWKRYVIGNTLFFTRVLKHKINSLSNYKASFNRH